MIVNSICYAAGFIALVRSAVVSLHSRIICEIGAVREIASDPAVPVLVPRAGRGMPCHRLCVQCETTKA